MLKIDRRKFFNYYLPTGISVVLIAAAGIGYLVFITRAGGGTGGNGTHGFFVQQGGKFKQRGGKVVIGGTNFQTPAFVQGNGVVNGPGPSTTISLPSTSAAGDLIVVTVTYDNNVTAPHVTSITDTQNTYVNAIPPFGWAVQPFHTETWYAKGVAGGSTLTITVNLNTAAGSFMQIYAEEYSGIDTVAPLDKVATTTASTIGAGPTWPFNSGSKTTTETNELVFGHGECNSCLVSKGGTFASRSSFNSNGEEDKNVISTGSYNADFSASQDSEYIALMATFKAARK